MFKKRFIEIPYAHTLNWRDHVTVEELINDNMPLIKHIASNFYNVSFEDLLQAGTMGILKAYKKYRKDGKTKFSTYAYDYIFGEMYDYVMKERKIKVSKDLLRLAKKIEIAKNTLSLKMNRIPTYEEIALFLEISPVLVMEALTVNNEMISLDNNTEESRNLYETIPTIERVSLDEKLTLYQGLEKLPESIQKIMEYRYFEDLTQQETAQKMGMTQVMVSRYESKGLKRLKEYYEVA